MQVDVLKVELDVVVLPQTYVEGSVENTACCENVTSERITVRIGGRLEMQKHECSKKVSADRSFDLLGEGTASCRM